MKACSGALDTALQTRPDLLKCELYTITLLSGVVLRYTTWPLNLVVSGQTYLAAGDDTTPGFRIGKTTTAIGLQVDSTDVDIIYDLNTLINGAFPGTFVQSGGFDGAEFKIDKCFMLPETPADTSMGTLNRYTGLCNNAKVANGRIEMTVSSKLMLLNGAFPRNYAVPQCNHALYDSGCTLSKAAFVVNGTLTSIVNQTIIRAGALSFPTNYFALGFIEWQTGANAGTVSEVIAYVSATGTFTLQYPLGAVPQVGDTFKAYPGCNKTRAACGNNNPAVGPQLNNLIHFRGFPDVPTPNTILMGSSKSSPGDNSGGNAGPGGGGAGRGPGGASGRTAAK